MESEPQIVQRKIKMKFGFIIGALFATWLTLNYPDQMRSYFTKAVEYIESVATFITSK